MLQQTVVVTYLREHRLLDTRSITQGDLEVLSAPGRNSNFKVRSKRGLGFMLKQGVGVERQGTLAHEARIYELFHTIVGLGPLSAYLPQICLYEPQDHVLIMDLTENAETLAEYYARRGYFSTRMAVEIGNLLGSLHRDSTWLETPRENVSWLSRSPVGVLTLHRPTTTHFISMSAANQQLIRIIQYFPEFGSLFDALRQEWKSETLIHADIRWSNFLVATGGKVAKLIDWEFALIGDPLWDVGSFFADYLGCWLQSVPITGEEPPSRFLDLARYPLKPMQPAMRSFWAAYVESMGFDSATADKALLKATRYAAAKLVQTAFEASQTSQRLTGNLICYLQVSLNMLERSHDAAKYLLGITKGGA